MDFCKIDLSKDINLEKLKVYQDAKILKISIFELVKNFPKEEKLRLAD